MAIEVYPYNANNQYDPYTSNTGGVRLQVNGFPNHANGGRYSTAVGNISLPQLGQAGVGKLNGFVTKHGVAASANRVSLDAFQNGSTRSTSTGHPMSGFSAIKNKGDGYYNLGAVPSGSYKIYVTDNENNHKVLLDGVRINLPHERLDFKLEQRCFGITNVYCEDPAR